LGAWPPGKIIGGHYEIRKILGKGGFGIVFEAVETATKRQVAIKIPLAAWNCNDTGRRRIVSFGWSDFTKQALLKEIRTWMSLVHPHIVEVFDVVDDDSTDYLPAICMQFCNGGNLARHVLRSGSLPLETRLDIAIQVCWALKYIHEQGFLHGDLKAANVLLVYEGARRAPLALLGDFGLARAMGFSPALEGSLRDAGVAREEQNSYPAGTVTHMAPELWEKDSTKGPAVDVYAFGVMLYEIFCGRPPFLHSRLLDLRDRHRSEPRPDPRRWNRHLPSELCECMIRCLEVDAAARPDIPAVENTLCEVYERVAGRPYAEVRRKPGAPQISGLVELRRAWAKLRTGVGAGRRGDYAEAEREFRDCHKVFAKFCEPRGIAASLGNLALILALTGRLQEALELFEEVERLYHQLEDPEGVAITLGNRALLQAQLGCIEETLRLLRGQQAIFHRLGDYGNLAISLAIEAKVLLDGNRREEALRRFVRSQRWGKKSTNRWLASRLLAQQAAVYIAMKNYGEALRLLEKQQRLCAQIFDLRGLMDCYGAQGVIRRSLGNAAEAYSLHQQEELLARHLNDKAAITRSTVNQAAALLCSGSFQEAEKRLRQALGLAEEIGLVPETMACLVNLALVAFFERQDRLAAWKYFLQAENTAARSGQLAWLAQIRQTRAELLGQWSPPAAYGGG
jgi:tetratricopeptide (TPR) repeat protein